MSQIGARPHIVTQAQVQRRTGAAVAGFNSLARSFRISADAYKVRYWYAYKQPIFEFDLNTRAPRPAASRWPAPTRW